MSETKQCRNIPLEKAMFAWNHGDGKSANKPAGFVGVCEHPDNGQLPRTDYWNAPFFAFQEKDQEPNWTKKEILLRLKMMVEAWHMACRDNVPLENIHLAFSDIPEYRQLLAEDFRVVPQ